MIIISIRRNLHEPIRKNLGQREHSKRCEEGRPQGLDSRGGSQILGGCVPRRVISGSLDFKKGNLRVARFLRASTIRLIYISYQILHEE